MPNTSSPPPIPGLSAIANDYRAIVCDVWGVIHNGVRAFRPACEALVAFRKAGGRVILITNAPRPGAPVIRQLAELGVEPEAFDGVVTSGDVTRDALAAYGPVRVFKVGPERDQRLYDGLTIETAGEEDAEVISCTGLFDDEVETPDDYEERLQRWAKRGLPFICANPDIVVERGDRLIYCAGALAKRYAELGGKTVIAGKPYPPMYEDAVERLTVLLGGPVKKAEILAIGDGLPTDIAGAFGQSIDVLFITGGIHAADLKAGGHDAVQALLERHQLGAVATMPRLAW